MEQHHDIVEKVDQSRRGFVRRALAGSFMVPVMASFGMSAMSISDAAAQGGNQGGGENGGGENGGGETCEEVKFPDGITRIICTS